MEKGVVMNLVIVVIEAGSNAAEVGVFHSMFWNVKFWILDLKASLGKGLKDTKEGEEESLEVGSHREDYNP